MTDPCGRSEKIAPLVDLAMPTVQDHLLDIGTGAGFVVTTFAPFVKKAVGIDILPETIDTAQRLARERGLGNVEFAVGNGAALAYPERAFDIVVGRFVFHHLKDPEKPLLEMKRVLKPEGRLLVQDGVASPDDRKAARYNEIERVRDASIVAFLQVKEWQDLFRRCGLKPRAKVVVLIKRTFDEWMNAAEADAQCRKRVREMVVATQAGDKAGMSVRVRDGRITFTQTHVLWLLGRE